MQGCNMNRPGLQELLKDVNEGKIDVVVVYKLDRISRSLRDFTELDGIFSRHGASMVSVTQQIDTSTSMGRMIVNLLMSFAQFEREMTFDRVRDKMAASRKKGIWTGGVIPYGYKSIDSKLVPDPENAPKVLYAFQRFAITRSYLETSRELNEKYGNHHADKRWNVMHVRTLLSRGPLRAASPCLRHLPSELRSSAHRDRRETRRRHIAAPALHGGRRQAHHASPLGRATRAPWDRLTERKGKHP